jgi:hypothetical protein
VPDWSYHTVLRPASAMLPNGGVRPLVLRALASIASLPGGGAFIEYQGQMKPPPTVSRTIFGMRVASPIGLGAGVDPDGVAIRAFARFGFGVIEIEPGAKPLQIPVRPPGVAVIARVLIRDDDEPEVSPDIASQTDAVCLAVDGHANTARAIACAPYLLRDPEESRRTDRRMVSRAATWR